jgi:hypothetical protein
MKTETSVRERLCLSCGKALDPKKRKDSKFCNEYCKAEYHNPKRGTIHPDIKNINKVLFKNYAILEKAIGKKDYIKRNIETILHKGFDLEYVTQTRREFRFVYRYGYHLKEQGIMTIFRGYDDVVLKEL